jgi:hypothetical protein
MLSPVWQRRIIAEINTRRSALAGNQGLYSFHGGASGTEPTRGRQLNKSRHA